MEVTKAERQSTVNETFHWQLVRAHTPILCASLAQSKLEAGRGLLASRGQSATRKRLRPCLRAGCLHTLRRVTDGSVESQEKHHREAVSCRRATRPLDAGSLS
jgi:hypothetical protein